MSKNRYKDWLRQAENDLVWAIDSISAGHYSGACFVAQQVSEKALKSLAYYRGADLVKSHSIYEIAKDLQINGELLSAAARLDQYYITPRYPDAVPAGAPFELFTKEQAEEAIGFARLFIEAVKNATSQGL